MKNLKKFLVVAFAFLATLTISGCGKGYAKSNLSANEAFEKSKTGTATVTSYKMEVSMDMAAKVEGKEQSAYMKETMSVDLKNMVSQEELSTNFFGTDLKITSYSKYDDTSITKYTNMFGSWSKETKELDTTLSMITEIGDSITLDNVKEIAADKDNYNYEAVVTPEDIKKISAIGGEASASDMLEALKDNIKMIISFDKETGYISKLKIDMMDIIKNMSEEELDGTKYSKALFEIKFYDYNKVPEITIPEEALNASGNDTNIDFEELDDENLEEEQE